MAFKKHMLFNSPIKAAILTEIQTQLDFNMFSLPVTDVSYIPSCAMLLSYSSWAGVVTAVTPSLL